MSGIQQMLIGGRLPPSYPVDAVDFDGTNDYMLRGAGLTGAVDSKLFTFVAWLRTDGSDGAPTVVLQSTEAVNPFRIGKRDTDILEVRCCNSAGGVILSATTSSSFNDAAGWKCVMFSANMASGPALFYFGDTSVLAGGSTFTDDTIDFTATDWSIGARTSGTEKWNGFMGPLMFWIGVKADFTSSTVRRYFIDASGWPVDPAAAIVALGTPILHHYIADGGAAAGFATNNGSGGNFSITGTLTTAANSPSD